MAVSRFSGILIKRLTSLPALHQHGCILSLRRYTDDNQTEYLKNRSEEFLYQDEALDQKRARLHWQSRKRGISETCLIFSTFSSKHLNSFTQEQVNAYDRLLNEPSNDWDVYYWMVGHKTVPKDYDNEIMKMLQEHCRNENKEERFEQPPLDYKPVTKANKPS